MSSLVVHFEIHASEPQRLIDFYSELLDWRFERYGDLEYWSIFTGEGAASMAGPGIGINGGLAPREGPPPGPDAPVKGANIVVGVDDADAVVARALELGGSVVVPAADMEGLGRFATLLDPDGNLFGIMAEELAGDGAGERIEPAGADGAAEAADPMGATPEP